MDNHWYQGFGNLGRDVELRYTDQGKLFGSTNIAVETGWGDKKNTEWVSVVIWGDENAQRFHDFCHKGTKVYFSGTPSVKVYKDKEGEPKAQLSVKIAEFRVLAGGKPKGEEEPTPYDP